MDEPDESAKSLKEETKEPSIYSEDPNERKLARRLRIQRRLQEAARIKAINDGTYVEPEPQKPPLDQAIEASEDVLENLLLEGKELVSNIRVASDAREVERREIEVEDRNNRLKTLEEEAALALQKLGEITQRWEVIQNVNDPLNLHQHMKEQKEKCLELIEQKNDLIKSFQAELKLADEKYMKDRRKMYEDLSLLTQRIDEQVLVMKRAYRLELKNIEDVIDTERSKIMEEHQKIWQQLYNQREREEVSNMEKKFKMVENHEAELDQLHKEHEEKYRETRIRFETDIQTLEQELERVKALCLLNSEKLDYNYQVLKKREEENIYIKNHQKRKLNKRVIDKIFEADTAKLNTRYLAVGYLEAINVLKVYKTTEKQVAAGDRTTPFQFIMKAGILQDTVNTLKKKIEEKRCNTDQELKQLHQEVLRYHASVVEIEKKAEHFSQMNEDTYQNIWDMKDQEAKEKLNKILSIDKIIHEQILGIPWTEPEMKLLDKKELPSYKSAKKVISSLFSKPEETKHGIDLGEGETSDGRKTEFEEGHRRLLRQILEMIADQSRFLVEEKLDDLLKSYTFEEKTLVRLDNVFTAIGIQTERDVNLMKNVFLPYAVCPICDVRRPSEPSIVPDISSGETREESLRTMSQTVELEDKISKLIMDNNGGSLGDSLKTDDGSGKKSSLDPVQLLAKDEMAGKLTSTQCNITHPLMIEKIYVLNALKDFVTEFHASSCGIPTGMAVRLAKQRNTVSRLLAQDDIKKYWTRFKQIFPAEHEKLWDALFIGLSRYHALLQERHRLNVKAQKLRQQNLELRRLLARYVTTDSNDTKSFLPRLNKENRNIVDMENLQEVIKNIKV